MKTKGLGRGLSALLPDISEEPAISNLLEVSLRDIRPNPYQPRKEFNLVELDELTASIRAKGVIQPLSAVRDGSKYILIAGERRLRAARQAGLRKVPIHLLEIDGDADLLELSLVENLQRNDLNPVELAEGYRILRQKWGLTQEIIARRVGKERATISNTLRILELPDQIRSSLRRGDISMGHAKAILSVSGAARQSVLWKRVINEALSVRQTEEAARQSGAIRKIPRKNSKTDSPPHIADYTDSLRRALGTQIRIQQKGKKGFIRIDFYSAEDLVRLVELMGGRAASGGILDEKDTQE